MTVKWQVDQTGLKCLIYSHILLECGVPTGNNICSVNYTQKQHLSASFNTPFSCASILVSLNCIGHLKTFAGIKRHDQWQKNARIKARFLNSFILRSDDSSTQLSKNLSQITSPNIASQGKGLCHLG